MLGNLKATQDAGGYVCDLRIGGNVHPQWLLKLPLTCVMYDCEGVDVFVGWWYNSHAAGVQSLCWDCDCPTAELADEPLHQCRPRTHQEIIDTQQDDVALQALLHYKLKNAFEAINFCDNMHGILG